MTCKERCATPYREFTVSDGLRTEGTQLMACTFATARRAIRVITPIVITLMTFVMR